VSHNTAMPAMDKRSSSSRPWHWNSRICSCLGQECAVASGYHSKAAAGETCTGRGRHYSSSSSWGQQRVQCNPYHTRVVDWQDGWGMQEAWAGGWFRVGAQTVLLLVGAGVENKCFCIHMQDCVIGQEGCSSTPYQGQQQAMGTGVW
jgi:hypothetical protein